MSQDPVPHGRLVHHPAFASRHLGNERLITVYLPPGYDAALDATYPVVYLHDGQNVFETDKAAFGISWDAAATADRLILQGRLTPLLQVAIANTPDRLPEYAPFPDSTIHIPESRLARYAQFWLEELKPFMERTYRCRKGREQVGMVGSSMGALATLALAWKHHDVFRYAGILSPSLWWARNRLLRELETTDTTWLRSMKFWLDMGNKEGGARAVVPAALQRTRRLVDLFDRTGLLPGVDYYYSEIAGGEHNEAHWASRYDKVLLYFFGRHPNQQGPRREPD
jgi:predicted alpha/beta superfamily hydrolase